jgi:hypothetical protein
MVDLDKYDPDVIDAAFWLQEHIRENGIDAVPFMDMAGRRARDGDQDVAEAIDAELRKL